VEDKRGMRMGQGSGSEEGRGTWATTGWSHGGMEPSKAVAARLNRAGWQRQIAKQGGARAEKKRF
jgi:hypothetical protein